MKKIKWMNILQLSLSLLLALSFFACGSSKNNSGGGPGPAPVAVAPVVSAQQWGAYIRVVDSQGYQDFLARFLQACHVNTGNIFDGYSIGAYNCKNWTSNNWLSIQAESNGQIKVLIGNENYQYTSPSIAMTYGVTNNSTQFRLAANDAYGQNYGTQGFGQLEIFGNGSLAGSEIHNIEIVYQGTVIAIAGKILAY